MKTVILILAITAGLAVRAHAETYDVGAFDRIDVRAGIELVIHEGQGFSIEAEALEGEIDRLIIERRGERLVVDRKPARSLLGLGSEDRFRVEVGLPDLERLSASSGANVEVQPDGDQAIRFDISSGASVAVAAFSGDVVANVSSGATFDLITSAATELRAEVSSGAVVMLSGPCGTFDARVSSGGRIEAAELTCDTVKAAASSGGSASVHARAEARLEASSSGHIRFDGPAQDIDITTSSGGSVDRR